MSTPGTIYRNRKPVDVEAERLAARERERQRRAERKAASPGIIRELKSQPCQECGGTYHPASMLWRHPEFPTREMRTSHMAEWSEARIRWHLEPLPLLCANCHRLLVATGR